jgi:hypothetical protein
MATDTLKGLKVAILIEEGFEQVEMVEPRKALDQAGAETRIVSPRDKHVRGWKLTNWGDQFAVDVALDQARPQEFDALLLPGGVMNPDMLRMEPKAVAFTKAFFDTGKPVNRLLDSPKVEPGLQILRYQSRPLLLRLEQAHRHPVENHVHDQETGHIGHDQRDLVSANGCQLVEERDSPSRSSRLRSVQSFEKGSNMNEFQP